MGIFTRFLQPLANQAQNIYTAQQQNQPLMAQMQQSNQFQSSSPLLGGMGGNIFSGGTSDYLSQLLGQQTQNNQQGIRQALINAQGVNNGSV